ncbi:MAG: DDE-type integrase/transposase/recombinase [Candidatus Bathyarchaeia archaeon]
MAIWNWVQRFAWLADRFKPKGVECILIDETQIKIGDKEAWVWLAFEPYRKAFLGFHISFIRNSLSAWIFLKRLKRRYGFKPIYTDGGPWYPLACKWARLKHYRYSEEWQNLMERAIQALKDRTECFDDYFPCWHEEERGCKARHVWN